MRTCKICETEFSNEDWFICTKSYILHHINKHHMKMSEIDITEEDLKEYRRINNLKVKERNRKNLDNEVASKNSILLAQLGEEEYNKLVVCAICGLRSNNLYSHIKIHGMSVDEYKQNYGDNLSSENFLNMLSDVNKGENNPMFNVHDAKNSPYAKEFYLSRGYSTEESEKMRQEKLKESVDNKKKLIDH